MDRDSSLDIAQAERLAPPNSVRAELDDLSEWRYLGSGGFSTVWVARERNMDRMVAVKVLEGTLDDAGRRRFEREITALGRLSDHPGIISIYRAGVTASATGWLVMEYAPEGTCADLLRASGRLPWPKAVDLMLSVVDALAAAHDHGLLHLDVKPSNILIGSYGDPKLGDFGLARSDLLSDADTLAGLHLTPHHAAPEVIRGETPTVRSDVWSATSTLFELIDGRPPFYRSRADIPGQVMRRIEMDPPRPLDVDEPPEELVAVLERGLAKDPAERLQTARDLYTALEGIPRPTAPPADVQAATRRWPRLIAALVPILLIASLSWLVLRGRTSEPAQPDVHSWFVGSDGGSTVGSVDLATGELDTVRPGWGGEPVTAAGGRLWGVGLDAVGGGTFAVTGIRSMDRSGQVSAQIMPSGLNASEPVQIFSAGPMATTLWVVQTQVDGDPASSSATTVWGLDGESGQELGRSSLAGKPSDISVASPAVVEDTLYLPWSDDYGDVKVARFAADGSNPTSFEFTKGATLDDEGRPGPTLEHLRLTSGAGRLYAVAEDHFNGLLQFWELDPGDLTVSGQGTHELIASAHAGPPVVVNGQLQVLVSRSFRQAKDTTDNRAELLTFGTDRRVAGRRIDIGSDSLPLGPDTPDTSTWQALTLGTRMYVPLWDTSRQVFAGLASIDVKTGEVRQHWSRDGESHPPVEVTDAGIALGSEGQVEVLEPDSLQVRQRVQTLLHRFDLDTVSGRVMRLDRSDGSVALLDAQGLVERTWTTHLDRATLIPDAENEALFLVGRSNSYTYAAPLTPETGPQPLREVDDAFASPTIGVRNGTAWTPSKWKDRNGFLEYTDFSPNRFIPTDAVLALRDLSLQPLAWSSDALYAILDTTRGPGDPVIATTDLLCPAGVRVCLQRIPIEGGAPTSVALPEDASSIDIHPMGLVVATKSGVEVREPTTLAVLRTGSVSQTAALYAVARGARDRIAWFDPHAGRLDVLDSMLQPFTTFDGGPRSTGIVTPERDQVWFVPGTGATPSGADMTTGAPLTLEPAVESVTAITAAGGRVYMVSGPADEIVVADPVLQSSGPDGSADGSRRTQG